MPKKIFSKISVAYYLKHVLICKIIGVSQKLKI